MTEFYEKNLLENKEMVFKIGVKNYKSRGYNAVVNGPGNMEIDVIPARESSHTGSILFPETTVLD
jgi:hypothetical protein